MKRAGEGKMMSFSNMTGRLRLRENLRSSTIGTHLYSRSCLTVPCLFRTTIMAVFESDKAGYTAQNAPSTRLKITGDGRTDGWTEGRTHLLIEMRRRI